ncbi:MAG TPA: LarC family nickel insertion protein, partial [Pirellulaceae bacterium]
MRVRSIVTMRIAYLDCSSGISGDMTLGALIDAGVPAASIQAAIDSLGLPGCRLEVGVVKRKGFRGTKVTVIHEPESAHRHLKHVLEIVERGQLTAVAKGRVEQVFRRLAEAEARVHGTTVEKVHFHEVGAVDSIVDIVGACVGWELLGVDRVVSSAVCVGGGTIEIAHGRCSVPAPATAELLQGIPLAASPIEAEL